MRYLRSCPISAWPNKCSYNYHLLFYNAICMSRRKIVTKNRNRNSNELQTFLEIRFIGRVLAALPSTVLVRRLVGWSMDIFSAVFAVLPNSTRMIVPSIRPCAEIQKFLKSGTQFTGPLACPAVRSLTSLAHSLAPEFVVKWKIWSNFRSVSNHCDSFESTV